MSVEGQEAGCVELKAAGLGEGVAVLIAAHPREGGDRVKSKLHETPAFAGVSGVRMIRE
jgi:hypothetical protein